MMADNSTNSSARGAWTFSPGDLAKDGWESVVDGSIDGWEHTGLRVANLEAEQTLTLPDAPVERIVIPLVGSFTVSYRESGAEPVVQTLEGRRSVFHGPSDVLYLGASCEARIEGSGRFAVAEAPTSEVLPAVYVPRESVAIELRGSGRNSRQVHNFGT
ncbi:MAG: 5-deoxy-glucuronate isomerase, partial [Dermatophilaceae bacterium]